MRVRDAPLRYRFTVVYRIGDDEIIIVAVAHHSRKPGYWRLR